MPETVGVDDASNTMVDTQVNEAPQSVLEQAV